LKDKTMKSTTLFKLMLATATLVGSTTLLLATSDESKAPQPTPAHTPFVTVLMKDFDGWDTNHDGTLSMDEINKVVMDPAVKGDDAAAAASIKLLSHSKKVKLPALTKEYFASYDAEELAIMAHRGAVKPADAVTATVDPTTATPTTEPAARTARANFDLYFTAGKARIAKGGPDHYPGRFVLDHTSQGPLGDCFFVASVTSMAVHDPARLEKIIEPKSDGSYVIKLPDTEPVVVPAITDAELAISSTTTGDGAWLAIMEQGFGKYKSREHGHGDDVEGTEIIRVGGDSAPTISALTGHKTLRIAPGKTVEARKANKDKMLPEIREQLTAAITNHRLITAGMDPPAPDVKLDGTRTPIPPNITIHHVYAVISYDPATDIIEMWNPHGQHFDPKGAPGIEHGFATEHGQFKLPLSEAFDFYTSFTFEQSTPSTKP
jgi:Calpain family cysteine protease